MWQVTSLAEEARMRGTLFIIARTCPDLLDQLRDLFAGEPIEVILDRRVKAEGRKGKERERDSRFGERRNSWTSRLRTAD